MDENDPNKGPKEEKETSVFLNGDECGSIIITNDDTYDIFLEKVKSISILSPDEREVVYKGVIIKELQKEIICYNDKGVISKDNFNPHDIGEHLIHVYITAVSSTLTITGSISEQRRITNAWWFKTYM